MRGASLAVVLVLQLSACAVNPPQQPMLRYSKPWATQQDFMKDRYDCLLQSQRQVSAAYVSAYGGASGSSTVCSMGVWKACLGARGYQVDPNGALGAPPDMVVYCQP
jgi:hypothetical protein